MNSLRTSFSSLARTALKGKGKGKGKQVLKLPLSLTSALADVRSISTSFSGNPQVSGALTSSSLSESVAGPSASTFSTPVAPATSTEEALALIKSQSSHYAVASITGRTYLITKGDLVTVPRLKDVRIGDILVLDKVHEIGSRDYTLRAQDTLNTRRISSAVDLSPASTAIIASLPNPVSPLVPQARRLFTRLVTEGSERSPLVPLANTWSSRLIPNGLAHIGASLPQSTVKITAIVAENTKGALERIVKTKKRKGYKKTVLHKQPYTRLRIEDIQIQPK